jgi:tripartite-type tricarboxylate transporter receptor subunit TctC
MRVLSAFVSTLLVLGAAAPASAQAGLTPLDGKTIRLIIGGSPANDTDKYGRAFLEGLQAVLPNTTILAQNLNGGGGSLALVEAMAATGTGPITLALTHSTPVYSQIFGSDLAVFDLNAFHWIGALTNNQRVLAVRKSLGVTDFAGLAALDRALVAPASGTAAEIEATLIAAMTPLRLTIVPDVDDGLRATLLMSGAADIAIGSQISLVPLIEAGELTMILRLGSSGYPAELDTVPMLRDVARPEVSRDIIALTESLNNLGRLVLAAPATDPAIVDALRIAFDAAMAHPATASAYQRADLILAPTSGAEVEAAMHDLLGNASAREVLVGYLACGGQEAGAPEQTCPTP